MNGRTCFSAPATALARVFLPATTPSRTGSHLVPRFLAPRGAEAFATISSAAHPTTARQQSLCLLQDRQQHQQQQLGPCSRPRSAHPRFLSTTTAAAAAATATGQSRRPAVFRGRGGGGSSRGGAGSGGSSVKGKGALPRDKDITHRYVIVRREDGSLSAPQPTAEVLATLNRHAESLVVLALPTVEGEEEGEEGRRRAGGGGAGNGLRFPICRVVDRIAERRAESDKVREQRKKAVALKALELNWSIDTHDLDHRLAKLREFLDKGLRVEVTLLRKGKGKNKKQAATQEHAAGVVRRVRAAIQAVPGAREVKAAEGELLKTLRLLVEGPAKKAAEKKDPKTGEKAAEAEAGGGDD